MKKQKQTRERSTQGRGANSIITEMAAANFDGQFEAGLSVPDSLCTATPGKGVSVGEGATVPRLVSDG